MTEVSDLAVLTVGEPLLHCLEAALSAAKCEDLPAVFMGEKKVPSAIGVLRGVASSQRHRLCAANSKSEDISLHNDLPVQLCHRLRNSNIVTCLAWDHLPNAIICVGTFHSYPFVFVCIMRS